MGNQKARKAVRFLSAADTSYSVPIAAFVSEPTDLLSAVLQHADESGSALAEVCRPKVGERSGFATVHGEGAEIQWIGAVASSVGWRSRNLLAALVLHGSPASPACDSTEQIGIAGVGWFFFTTPLDIRRYTSGY